VSDESQVCHQLSAAWCCSKSRPTVVSLCFVADMFVRFEIASEKRPLVRHVANLQREVWQGCDLFASGAGRREVLSVLAVAPVLSCSSMKSATQTNTSFSFFRMFFTEAAFQMLLLLKTCPATTMTLGFCTSFAHLFRFQMRKNVVANFYGPSD
jgi:hypothetical protein